MNQFKSFKKILFEKEEDDHNNIQFILNSNDGFIFTSFDDKIMQFKIIQDEEGNFIRLKKFGEINAGLKNRAIITFENGKIFYKKKTENSYEKSLFILDEYKIKIFILGLINILTSRYIKILIIFFKILLHENL